MSICKSCEIKQSCFIPKTTRRKVVGCEIQQRRAKMTLNKLAKLVSELEGKKKQVNIAQIKEVLACTNKVLNLYGINFYTIVRNAK